MQGSEGAPPLPPKGVLGRTLQAVSGLGSAAVSLTPAWAKSGLKHLVCNIADVVAPPLPPENAHVTVEEQISEQLSSISTILQQQQLNDGSDQATHAKLAIQYQLTRISQVLDERKRRTSCSDDVVVAASITSSSSSSSSISSSSDNDGTVIMPRSGVPAPPPTADTLRLLFSRTRHGRHKELAAILSQGIPVDIRDEFGNTPLLIAAQNGHLKIVKMLLRSRANINAQNHKGMSAMHFAFTFGYPELGSYLVSKGGDDSLKNSDNRTCYECSSSSSLQSLSAPADSLRLPSTPAFPDTWDSTSTEPCSPFSQPPSSPAICAFSELASPSCDHDSISNLSASDGALYLARAAQQHVAAQNALLSSRLNRGLSASAASAAALPSTPTVSYFSKQESSIGLPPSPGSPYQSSCDALSSRDTERSSSGVTCLRRGDSLGV